MRTTSLGQTGLTFSELGLGGAALGQQYGPVSVAEGVATVRAALDQGVTFLDTSAYYGEGVSETILGTALQGVPRDHYCLGTKAGRLGRDRFDFSATGIRRCLESSLQRLQLDHVDLLLAHDIEFAPDLEQIFTETVEVLHQLRQEGKCRAIGMSGYPLPVLSQVIERCSLDVVMTYCQWNLQNDRARSELLPVATKHGAAILNASPLGMGLFAPHGTPPWHPAPRHVHESCQAVVRFLESAGVSPARFALRYCLDQSAVLCTVLGAGRPAELQENLKALSEPLDTELLATVETMLAPVRGITWPSGNWQPR